MQIGFLIGCRSIHLSTVCPTYIFFYYIKTYVSSTKSISLFFRSCIFLMSCKSRALYCAQSNWKTFILLCDLQSIGTFPCRTPSINVRANKILMMYCVREQPRTKALQKSEIIHPSVRAVSLRASVGFTTSLAYH